jgi:acetylornithine deacetylase
MRWGNETYLELLRKLIATPSLSRDEGATADILEQFLIEKGIPSRRFLHNVYAINLHYDAAKPTLLLNSHHDTVKPNTDYTRDPFSPDVEKGKLYGLGSNDAGGALVALLACFLHFYDKPDLAYNLIWAGTAEEEISGANGIAALLPHLGKIDLAVVGEPTLMQMAIAEKGLMVLDCISHGKSGHAARNEGLNAIYLAMQDIAWFQSFQFPKESPLLGPVKMTVTIIEAGTQHNVVPDQCRFTVDVRTTDAYTNKEVLDIIREHVKSEVNPRSLRLQPSFIPADHPLVKAGKHLGMSSYGSPTLSDQALLSVPSLKIGPGDSARSHTADEYLHIDEFYDGIEKYIALIQQIL